MAVSDDGQYLAALTHQNHLRLRSIVFNRPMRTAPQSPRRDLSQPVHRDSSLAWESAADSPALIVVQGNGSEPAPWNAQKLEASSGKVLSEVGLKRWKLADKGLVVGKKLAIVRCCFDRLAVVRLSDLSIVGYVMGFPNSLIADFEFNTDESRVVFAQDGEVIESKWINGTTMSSRLK